MLGVPVVVDPNGIQIGHFSNTEANSSREAGRGKKHTDGSILDVSFLVGHVISALATYTPQNEQLAPGRRLGPQKETHLPTPVFQVLC